MTIEQFSAIYSVLGLQLQAADPSIVAVRAYYRVLQHLEPALLQLAAEQLAATARWFPKSSEWLKAALAIQQARRASQRDTIRQLHRRGIELCARCHDTGWMFDAADRVSGCPCQELRLAEILGVKPLPGLNA
jgi:hypothetical protein